MKILQFLLMLMVLFSQQAFSAPVKQVQLTDEEKIWITQHPVGIPNIRAAIKGTLKLSTGYPVLFGAVLHCTTQKIGIAL